LMLYSCSYCGMFCQLKSSTGVRPVLADLLESCRHNLWSVVDSKHDICDASGRKGFDLMKNHRLVAELDQRLREGKGQWAETCAEATDENEGYGR